MIAAVWLLLAVAIGAQTEGGAFEGLTSPTLASRAETATRLAQEVDREPALLSVARTQDLLISALELENDLIRRNLERPKGQPSLLGGEEYGEHYSQVLGLTDRLRSQANITGARRVRLLRALVLGTYNGDSPFAAGLAKEGEAIVPFVLEAMRSSNGPTRWNGLELTASMFVAGDAAQLKAALSPGSQAQLRSASRAALQDPAPDVRRLAVDAVVAAKDRESIPLLRFMAEKDSDGAGWWSVRARAREGEKKLQQLR